MNARWTPLLTAFAAVLLLAGASGALAQSATTPIARAAGTLNLGGVEYQHRWSKDDQNEFTPEGDGDLSRWHDMVTINVNESVRNGDELASLANRVLVKYQSHGKILKTDSRPRTPQRPAEHLVVAVLGDPNFLEAAFARFALVDGVGIVAVHSHRIYGKEAGNAMSEWLKTNGASREQTLMAWDKMPSLSVLKRLPQSR